MGKPIKISIPTPCHQDWQQMTPVEKGRFCASCAKKVFDFTKLADEEIISSISKNQNICITAKANQLNRRLLSYKNSALTAASMALAAILSLHSQAVSAQTTEPIQEVGKYNMRKKMVINGIVADSVKPVQDVRVVRFKRRRNKMAKILEEVVTDDLGKFSIEVKIGDCLIFFKDDYEPLIVDVEQPIEELNILLQEESTVIMIGKVKVDTETY